MPGLAARVFFGVLPPSFALVLGAVEPPFPFLKHLIFVGVAIHGRVWAGLMLQKLIFQAKVSSAEEIVVASILIGRFMISNEVRTPVLPLKWHLRKKSLDIF